ncbi:hypothetical protein N657DRAFT_263799 [Parathielavia appendiculata]|uniref:Uncharacterized protein n=1 Tax=Parathielavia appendiculata TaxID=2587402 RepID=A0AAN6TRC0_9PEZI|nr:hypothetical protein N657DRAFT_263799 [Parathielavia appendiculata]
MSLRRVSMAYALHGGLQCGPPSPADGYMYAKLNSEAVQPSERFFGIPGPAWGPLLSSRDDDVARRYLNQTMTTGLFGYRSVGRFRS